MEETNIKVVCRFRPLNELEKQRGSETCAEYLSETTLKIPNTNPTFTYSFDHVFQPSCTQEQVYNTAARPIIDSVMRGFNGTVFAYGQTSSGKTFTMMGPSEPSLRGIIPRMVETVFDFISSSAESIAYDLKVAYCEIYLEKIKDLLDPSKVNLKVHENKARGVYIEGLTECGIGSEQEVYNLMALGGNNREVAYTNMNAGSSRSHSLFIITISQTNSTDLSTKTGKLFLVDLAGSEKIGKTGAAGARLEEAKNINKSLTTLGLVINNLTDGKSTHVPYRDSKLTRILQEALGGNSKTSLIITCSPSFLNEAETVSTLRFGMSAKNIKNKAKINREFTLAELKLLLSRAQEEIESKNTVIKSLESRLKGELGIDIVIDERPKNNDEFEEIMSEIEEFKERVFILNELYEKEKTEKERLKIENTQILNVFAKIQSDFRILKDKSELYEETCKDQETLLKFLTLTKEKIEQSNEDSLKIILDREQEIRNKDLEISKLRKELEKKDFSPTKRQVSMTFSQKSLYQDSEELDKMIAEVKKLTERVRENETEKIKIINSFENQLNEKDKRINYLTDQIEVLQKDNSNLSILVKDLEKSFNDSLVNSNLTNEEKIKQKEDYFLKKLKIEEENWKRERDEIMKDLNNRIERVLYLEMLLDSQNVIIDDQRRASFQNQNSLKNNEIQTQMQQLIITHTKEKVQYNEAKIRLALTQQKLTELYTLNKKLAEELSIVQEKLEIAESKSFADPLSFRKPGALLNIKKTILGGGGASDPRKQSKFGGS